MRNLPKILICLIMALFCFDLPAQHFAITEIREFSGYSSYVRQTKFSPYGNYIAITIGDNTVELYDKKFNKLWSNTGNYQSVAGQVAFSPDEKYLAFSKQKTSSDVGILRLADLQVIQTLSEHQDYLNGLAYSPDGKFLVTTSDDYSVIAWKWDGSKFTDHKILFKHTMQANAVAFSPDGSFLTAAFQDGMVKVWQLKNESFSDAQTFEGNKYSVECMVFHPSGKYFATGGSDFSVHIYSREGNAFKVNKEIHEDYGTIYKIAFSPDGQYLAATRSNSTVKIWKIDGMSFTDEKVIPRHSKNMFDVDFSSDGRLMSTSSSDQTAVIWSVEGIGGSPVSQVQQYTGTPFTSAQRRIMSAATAEKVFAKIDKSLSAPKDEFESKAEYQKRREKLRSHVLLLLQTETERFFDATASKDKTKISVNLQKLGSYDADSETYIIHFLETSGKVVLPVAEARALKEGWNKAKITSARTLSKDGISYNYNDFQLVHPATGKTYPVQVEENPFNHASSFTSEKLPSGNHDANDVEDPALFDKASIPGVNYALLLATNDYNEYPDLTNPVSDARTIAKELKTNYNFQVQVVENASVDSMMAVLRIYAQKKYNPKDQLFIFVAGHGKYDEVFKEGYLVARESKLKDETKTTLLSHSNLRTIVNNIPCEHIFLTMDACFGGTFDPVIASRGTDIYTNITKTEFIDRKLAHKTRLYLTSGGKEYVPDGRPGEHSPFARKLLEALRSYGGEDGILTTREIFTYVEKVVPQPRIGEFGANEPGSDFIFVAR